MEFFKVTPILVCVFAIAAGRLASSVEPSTGTIAKAGIGYTPRKFAETFGSKNRIHSTQVTEDVAGFVTYFNQAFEVHAHFKNGRCDFLTLTPPKGWSFTAADEDKYRKEYCGNRTWLPDKQKINDSMVWMTSDRQIVSEVDPKTHVLGIYIFDVYIVESVKKSFQK